MPVDPSISLQVHGGSSGPANAGYAPPAASTNPLSMMEGLVGIQEKMNSIQLFNKTMSARKKFGEIMASAPNPETGVQSALADPEVSAFVPDLVQSTMATRNALQTYRGQVQTQSFEGIDHVFKMLPAGMTDPRAVDPDGPLFKSVTDQIADPEVRAKVKTSGATFLRSLTEDLDPKNPVGDYTNRVIAASGATGTQDIMQKILGSAETQDLGGKLQPVVRNSLIPTIIPGRTPGAVTSVGAAVPKSLSPQVTNVSGTSVVVGGESGVPGPQAGAKPQTKEDSLADAGDGKPLIPEGYDMEKAPWLSKGTGIAGANVPNPTQAPAIAKAQEDFQGPDRVKYEYSQQSKMLLKEMDNSVNTMARGGGFLVPGAAATLRVDFAKLVNTIGQMVDDKDPSKLTQDLPFPPDKIATAEQFIKDTQRMGLALTNVMLGNQREAAETINNITKAVPGIENTVLGAKLLIASIGALTDRSIAMRHWKEEWGNRNQGNLLNSEEEFNKQHPIAEYEDRVLKQFGLDKERGKFKSSQDIMDAMKSGMLTYDEGMGLLKKGQFIGAPAKPGEKGG